MLTRAPQRSRTLKERAVALLARRDYSRAELAKRLAATGAPHDEIEATLNALAASNLLCDARAAAAVVHRRAEKYGRRAIAHALREKGVDAATTALALAALPREDFALARAVWARRFDAPPHDDRDKARQARFLLSRGFSHATTFKVLGEVAKRAGDDST